MRSKCMILLVMFVLLGAFLINAQEFDIDIPDTTNFCNCDKNCEDKQSCLVEDDHWLTAFNTKADDYVLDAHDAGFNGICIVIKQGKDSVQLPVSTDCAAKYSSGVDEEDEEDEGLKLEIGAGDDDSESADDVEEDTSADGDSEEAVVGEEDEEELEDEEDLEGDSEDDALNANTTEETFFGVKVFKEVERREPDVLNNATRIAIAIVAIGFFILLGWLAYLFKVK